MEIKKEDIVNAYVNGDESARNLLRTLFPNINFEKELRASIPVTERIKTFEDAVAILGNDNQAVIDYYAIADATCTEEILAFAKLRVIVEALNEGWRPKLGGEEYCYFPWFYIYTKQEYEELNEDEKKSRRVVGRSESNAGAGGGVAYASVGYTSSNSYTNYGSRLVFKSRELAEYAGEQFIDIWKDFLC